MHLGDNVREFLKKYGEPIIDEQGGRIYEWIDDKGVYFRLVIGDKGNATAGVITSTFTTDGEIITYYSNRNLKNDKIFEFKNPQLQIKSDENGNISFNPTKFLQGFAMGAGGTLALRKALENPKNKAKLEKFATIARLKAKKANKMNYETFKKIDNSQKFGTKMELIGKENLNAELLNYALAKNKRFAINKLDEKIAKKLNFHYPSDVRRTIQPDEIIHTLNRHGENSNLAQHSGQKPVTLYDIANY